MNRRTHIVAVTALALLWAAIALPNVFSLNPPVNGCIGVLTASRGLVTHVECAALKTGIVPGDRILFDRVPLNERFNASRTPWAGTRVTWPVLHNGKVHTVTLVAEPKISAPYEVALLALRRAAQLTFIIVAAVILLRRPSRVTWGFYLYALGNDMINVYFYTFLPAIAFYVLQFTAYMLAIAGQLGLVVFALRFPNDRAETWRARAERLVPYVFIAGAIYIGTVYTLDMLGILNGIAIMQLQYLPSLPLYAWAWYALARSYAELRANDRMRVQWAMAGTFFGTFLFLSGYTNFPFGGYFPEWMLAPSNILAELAIPLAIGYAIVRHRVFDIEFVANRTIVFGTLGVIGILLFAGLDWLSANVLPDSKTSVATALAVAVTFGYAAARKFSALSALVDRVMFPRRYCSGVRLHELRVAIESQNDGSQTLQTLVGGVCKALGLASAAVFRASSDGGFVREYAAGWPSGSTWHLLSTDRIVHDTLAATDKPLRVRDQWASGTSVPQGFARPILCCPIGNHGRRIALVFYSSHTDGSEIDPDEARALMKLCNVYGRDALM